MGFLKGSLLASGSRVTTTLGQRLSRHDDERRVAVGEVAGVVDQERAGRAFLVFVPQPQEGVDQELAAAIEQVDQAGLALTPWPRRHTTCRSRRSEACDARRSARPAAGELPLIRKELPWGDEPLVLCHELRIIHLALLWLALTGKTRGT
jgi:hypothetical protein